MIREYKFDAGRLPDSFAISKNTGRLFRQMIPESCVPFFFFSSNNINFNVHVEIRAPYYQIKLYNALYTLKYAIK